MLLVVSLLACFNRLVIFTGFPIASQKTQENQHDKTTKMLAHFNFDRVRYMHDGHMYHLHAA